jgi:hypothetical protein
MRTAALLRLCWCLALPMAVSSCTSDTAGVEPEADVTADGSSPADVEADTPDEGSDEVRCSGDVLFGRPNETTGLTAEQCAPTCTCGGVAWSPPPYDEAFLASLRRWELENPVALPDSDPYGALVPPEEAPDAVCAFLPGTSGDWSYRLETFNSTAEAVAAGGIPSHTGACGVCSSLDNLAVYIGIEDLTEPVRECGLLSIREGEEANMQCLRDLGFGETCARIWYWNTQHTRAQCLEPCLAALEAPYHLPDGSLNACILCDEVQSGPVFKAVAGRTRRNSGLANALCRPCSEVRPIEHRYPTPETP